MHIHILVMYTTIFIHHFTTGPRGLSRTKWQAVIEIRLDPLPHQVLGLEKNLGIQLVVSCGKKSVVFNRWIRLIWWDIPWIYHDIPWIMINYLMFKSDIWIGVSISYWGFTVIHMGALKNIIYSLVTRRYEKTMAALATSGHCSLIPPEIFFGGGDNKPVRSTMDTVPKEKHQWGKDARFLNLCFQ